MVPDPSSLLPLVDKDDGAIGSQSPFRRLQEDNSRLLDEVMHQQDKREELEAEKDQLEQHLQQTAQQQLNNKDSSTTSLAEVAQAKKALQQQTRSQTVVMPARKEHKPQQYKIGRDYATWAAKFQAVVTKNDWSEDEAAFNLRMALSPEALELVQSVSEALDTVEYPEVLEYLADIFIPADQISRAASEFEIRYKKPEESGQTFALDLIKLYRKANPGDIDEAGYNGITHRFILGCGDRELALYLRE